MSPRTEGFSAAASGSSPSLFIAMPATTTTGGTTQTTVVDSTLPLFAALTVHGNDVHQTNAVTRPLFIIGQQQRPKTRCPRKKLALRPSKVLQKCKIPEIKDSATSSLSSKPFVDKSSAPVIDPPKPNVNIQQDSLSFSSKPKVVGHISKNAVRDPTTTTTLDGSASISADQPAVRATTTNTLDGSASISADQPAVRATATNTLDGSASISADQPAVRATTTTISADQPAVRATATTIDAGKSTAHSVRKAKQHVHIFSFNPNRHRLNSGNTLGKAHSIDFLSRPATSPISRTSSSSSASSFSFKPNAAGAFANASTVNFSSVSYKPQSIVSIGEEPKDACRSAAPPANKDPKITCSTFSFKPNATSKLANPSFLNVTCTSSPCANKLEDSVSPFSCKSVAPVSFGNTPTFNFVYNPTRVENIDAPSKTSALSVNAKASPLPGTSSFGNTASTPIYGKTKMTGTGFTFSPGNVSKSIDLFPTIDPIPSTFSFGNTSSVNQFPEQCSSDSNLTLKSQRRVLRQSSTGFLFSPSDFQTRSSLGAAANTTTSSNTLFNIGASPHVQPIVLASPNTLRKSTTHVQQPLQADNTNTPIQTLQCFNFGNNVSSAVSALPPSAGNPFLVQIQNASPTGQRMGGNCTDTSQTVAISQTNSSQPCISITANNNLVIQITNDSVQVIINSSANS